MTLPLKNLVYEKVKEAGSLTDSELSKILAKEGIVLPDDEFNKTLLDLEIYGLIKVGWLTKDERRIEVVEKQEEEDEIEVQNREKLERDYEAGFPGVEQEQDQEV
ncbi:MAG TPA: hypothetical protein VLA53_00285 [Nitrosopumilaceae archaeon]|nr:hypothetical protein [Nitrosopumilaceae archaeon]